MNNKIEDGCGELPHHFKMCDVPEEMLIYKDNSFIEDLLLSITHYKPVNVSKCGSPKVLDEITEDKKLKKYLKWKDKRYRKKRKHLNDTKRHFREVKRHKCWVEYVEWSYYEHVIHKQRRQAKVFTEEEYDVNFWYGGWDDSTLYDEIDLEEWSDMFEGEYDWKDYVDESGRVLEKCELIEEQLNEECCYSRGNYSCDGSCVNLLD